MKKTGIYLAVRSQITVCAIEALLTSLVFFRNVEVVGIGSDLETCINDVRRLKPELVLTDQEICNNQEICLCRKLAEYVPEASLICLQSSICSQDPAGSRAVRLSRSDFNRERLTEALRYCLNDRSKKEKENESCRILIAAVDTGKNAGSSPDILPHMKQILNGRGCSLKEFDVQQGVRFYLAEGKHRRTLQQDLQKMSDQINGKKTGIRLIFSAPFPTEEDISLLGSLFEDAVERRIFYQSEQSDNIDLKAEQNRLFSEIQPEAFPEAHFSRILEKGEFRQAAALVKWYLERAGKRQWDCRLLKLNMLEAGLRLLQCQKPDLTAGDACEMKRKIFAISDYEKLQNLCREWTDGLLIGKEEGGIEGILHYIQTNYYEDLTLTGVAELFNYNYYYLSSAFLRQAGVTFTEYLNQVRIQEACRLLADSEIPVSMVADMTGYASSGYFSRIFKKHQGCAPSEYRREIRRQPVSDCKKRQENEEKS